MTFVQIKTNKLHTVAINKDFDIFLVFSNPELSFSSSSVANSIEIIYELTLHNKTIKNTQIKVTILSIRSFFFVTTSIFIIYNIFS